MVFLRYFIYIFYFVMVMVRLQRLIMNSFRIGKIILKIVCHHLLCRIFGQRRYFSRGCTLEPFQAIAIVGKNRM